MKLLLHIGTGKTGSTSVQSFLQANKDRICGQGIFIPSCLGRRNHRKLAAIVQDHQTSRKFMTKLGITEPHQRKAAKNRWRKAFLREIASVKDQFDHCLITAEHLCYLDDVETERLHRLLSRAFQSVDILVYLRNPIDYELAMYDTALKVGGLRPGPRQPVKGGETDYKTLLTRWGEVFGMDRLNVRIFDRHELLHNDITTDFAEASGLDTDGFVFPENENASLDVVGQALLRRINRKLPAYMRNGRPNPRRRQIHRILERHFTSGPKHVPDPELVETFHNVLEPSNEWVRRTFFPERKRLFPDKRRQTGSNPDIGPKELDQVAEVIVDLWSQK